MGKTKQTSTPVRKIHFSFFIFMFVLCLDPTTGTRKVSSAFEQQKYVILKQRSTIARIPRMPAPQKNGKKGFDNLCIPDSFCPFQILLILLPLVLNQLSFSVPPSFLMVFPLQLETPPITAGHSKRESAFS